MAGSCFPGEKVKEIIMKKGLFVGLIAGIVVIFFSVNNLSAEKRGDGKELKVLIGNVESIFYDYENNDQEVYVQINGEKIALSPHVMVKNRSNAFCGIEELPLPYLARIVILMGDEGEEKVIRIFPGEI